ncbi:MAG: porin [Variovorax sp.]|nr:porin [Variovorax sp.]
MKKSLVALAALATVGAASAQSSVTLFGVLDAAISSYSNKAEDKNFASFANPTYVNRGSVTSSRTALTSSGHTSSRIGFRGTEDLGGGLAASFWLEASLGNDDGTAGAGFNKLSSADASNQFFNRRSTVSLSGAFGEVRLGRDYTPVFWNDTVFDPFGTNGVGANLVNTATKTFGQPTPDYYTRTNNSVGYFLPPNLGGFYGQVMYSFNEKDSFDPATATPNAVNNSRQGRYIGGRFGYANGPLDVAAAYGTTIVGDQFYRGVTNNLNAWNLGGSYDFGVVKLFAEYSQSKIDVANDNPLDNANPLYYAAEPSVKGWLLGATVPVGPGLIRVAYSAVKYDLDAQPTLLNPGAAYNPLTNPFLSVADPKANKFAIGYVHNLSKRTALYATVARISNKDGAGLTVGGPGYVSTYNGATLTPKTSTGYDLGLRHAF